MGGSKWIRICIALRGESRCIMNSIGLRIGFKLVIIICSSGGFKRIIISIFLSGGVKGVIVSIGLNGGFKRILFSICLIDVFKCV